MRRGALVVVVGLAVAACSDGGDDGRAAPAEPAEPVPATVEDRPPVEEEERDVPGTFVDISTRSSGDTVVVTGRSSPGATVTVDGAAVEVGPDGSFSVELPRTGSPTTVEAVAEGTDGGRATATATVG